MRDSLDGKQPKKEERRNNGLTGPVYAECDNCGEYHNFCPICGNKLEEDKRMKNGTWAMGYADIPAEIDFICSEWSNSYNWVYFHTDDSSCHNDQVME